MKGTQVHIASDSGLFVRDGRYDDSLASNFGNDAPLISGNGRRAPDKRRVSARWLSGSVLTGLTSMLLMGGSLYAALDGRQQLAQPASILNELTAQNANESGKRAQKGDRPVTIVALKPVNEKVLQVPTMTRVGDDTVIRKRPFAYASAPLAIALQKPADYPSFNPLTVFRSSNADVAVASSDVIYGADIENEVRVQQIPFPIDTGEFDNSIQISAKEAETNVREARTSLADGRVQVAALSYIDTTRFALKEEEIGPTTALDIKIIAENVSDIPKSLTDAETVSRFFSEEVVSVPEGQPLSKAISGLNLDANSMVDMVSALTGEFGVKALPDGTKLRVAWEQATTALGPKRKARRISVYRSGKHIKSIAYNDDGAAVWANEPAPIPAVASEEEKEEDLIKTVSRSNLPDTYNGVYRAALSQGLNTSQARRIVRTIAFDVDFRKQITGNDSLEVFYSIEDGLEEATDKSEILYIGLDLGGVKRSYYRFKASDDGSVDYYDETGKSAKKFLLRKPVPNGKFRSSFGPRRHPISRVVKMHQGVDFSAPRGTRIVAAGNGVVEKAGWAGGYGRQTIIRHANGYKSSYNHQHRIAKGVRPGARVRQGQIIGQVGSTGYSTGPHLHYEVIVNGRKVNPMKIRLPNGKTLQGEQLAAFERERDRINSLIEKGRGNEQTVAALN